MISSGANARNSVPNSKPENIGFGGRADARESLCLAPFVPTQKNRALMRDRQLQTEPPKKERLSFADNKSALIHLSKMVPVQQNPALMRDRSCQPDSLKKERLSFADNKSASALLLKWVPTQQNRALMRGRSCLPCGFNRSRVYLLQKNVDSSKASNKGPTSVSTTDAVTARDFAQLTPRRARHT